MNILVDGLPYEYKGFKLRTDYRVGILFELLMQDNEITDEEKIIQVLGLYFDENEIEKALKQPQQAIEAILWFYTRGKQENKKKATNTENTNQKRIYDFEIDADLIYSAFMETYKIDLTDIKMHWWKFKALFEGLNENCKLMKIMSYRGVDLNQIKDKNEKERYKKLQKQFALQDMRTEEQKERDFGNAFW